MYYKDAQAGDGRNLHTKNIQLHKFRAQSLSSRDSSSHGPLNFHFLLGIIVSE